MSRLHFRAGTPLKDDGEKKERLSVLEGKFEELGPLLMRLLEERLQDWRHSDEWGGWPGKAMDMNLVKQIHAAPPDQLGVIKTGKDLLFQAIR